MGSFDEALAVYQQAIKLSSDAPVIYLGLGDVFEELGRNNDALVAYKKAISLYNNFGGAYLALGKLYLKIGDKNAAIEEYMKLKPIDKEAANELYKLIYKMP